MAENYFVCANSTVGFVNFFPQELDGMKKVYIIKGGPGTGKSTMMRKIGKYFENTGCDIGYIHCSSDHKSLDGVIIKDYSFAIVDGTSPHVVEPTAPGAKEEYISLSNAWDSKSLSTRKSEILKLNESIAKAYRELYIELKDAGKIHNQIKKIYSENTDFKKIDRLADALESELFKNISQSSSPGTEKHRFSRALTPDGSCCYTDELSLKYNKRFLIKGYAGTGKSAFMERFINSAKSLNADIEVYHCAFDPSSVDMVCIPSLKLCLLNASPPHEIFPSEDSDVILDFYETAFDSDRCKDNSDLLDILNFGFTERMNSARSILKKAKSYHDELEGIYTPHVDFEIIDNITDSIIFDMENNII